MGSLAQAFYRQTYGVADGCFAARNTDRSLNQETIHALKIESKGGLQIGVGPKQYESNPITKAGLGKLTYYCFNNCQPI